MSILPRYTPDADVAEPTNQLPARPDTAPLSTDVETGKATTGVTVPDLQQAHFAWSVAYRKRDADGVFLQWCQKLRAAITDLWNTAAAADGVTFSVIAQMPEPARDFYSDLIDATECLDELIDAHDRANVQGRHEALILIGDALGVLKIEQFRARIEACCQRCRAQLTERTRESTE